MASDDSRAPLPARRLLVVAFHYPPDNSSTGVLRTQKFTEYLVRHGWRSHVISVPVALYANRNPDAADPLPPGVTVERTWACDLKASLGIRGIYPGWLATPDRHWPWLFPAVRAGLRVARGPGADAIFATCPIPTALLAGLRLKRRTGLPFVADFRDPWVDATMRQPRRWFEGRLERAVVAAADRVICNTPAMRREFLRAYPDCAAGKFVTITNGYDEATLAAVRPRRGERFRIIHAGALDGANRNPRDLFLGVRRALERGLLRADDLELVFLGTGPYAESAQFRRDLDESGLRGHLTLVQERIAYRTALAETAGADAVAVLSEGDDRAVQSFTALQVPVKLYECLRLGRPLVALVSEGAVRELLESTGMGSAVAPRDVDAVAAALGRIYANRGAVPPMLAQPPSPIAAYSRERLAAQLADELDAVVGAPRNRSRAPAGSPA